MGRLRRIVVLCSVAALAATGAAHGADPSPELPAIHQYVEVVPTPAGPASAAAAERVQPLPARVARRVEEEAGDDADALTSIATSSRYGAPVQPGAARAKPPAPAPAPAGDAEEEAEEPVLEAAPVEHAEETGNRTFALGAFMAGSLVAAGAYQLLRRRRSS